MKIAKPLLLVILALLWGSVGKFDRRETEFFRKRTNLRCGPVIVAREEHDSNLR